MPFQWYGLAYVKEPAKIPAAKIDRPEPASAPRMAAQAASPASARLQPCAWQAFDMVRKPMALSDASGRLAYANQAFVRLAAQVCPDVTDSRALTLAHVFGVGAKDEALVASIARGEAMSADVVLESTSKAAVKLRAQVEPLEPGVSGGDIVGPRALVLCDDLTQGAAAPSGAGAQPALQSADLNSLTHALAFARDESERANAVKSNFLATMSHEVRTPLNGVLGMLQLLLAGELDANQRDYAETAVESANALLTVINDVLDFSRMEGGRLELERIAYDLAVLVGGIAQGFDGQAREKGLTFRTEIAPDVPDRLMGDPARVRQVVSNLIGNAIKFTKKGSVSLHVSLIEAGAPNGAMLRFEVRDTGIGIAEADRAKIFEGFSQLDSSNTRVYGGTGLGLSICHRLAIMMGGTIGVEITLGEGSVFRLEIPCQPAQADKAPALVADLSRTRIVMTGTALSERQSLIEGLQDAGAKAEIVSSTRDALDRLQAMVDEGGRRPVVIYAAEALADDAAEFARRVKANRAFENCPLILLIRSGLRGDAARSKSLGFSAYLSEPLDAEIMLRCLRYFENKMDIGRKKSGQLITIHSLKEAIGRVPVVLIAEDHPVNQKLAVALMQRLGCSTVVANDGAEAVERVKAGGIDMVLMDVQMPVMDGISATRAIRELGDAAAWLPIIAVTAHAMAGDEEKYKAAGMDDFVPKPIEPERLKNTMLHWLRRTTEPGLGAGSARLGAAHGLPVLDQAVLDALERWLGKAGVIELVKAFLETTGQHLDALDRAIAAGDIVKVGAEVHDLKSSSGNLGARQLAAQARAIQAAAKSEPIEAVRDLMIPLRAQFDAARKAFGERYRA